MQQHQISRLQPTNHTEVGGTDITAVELQILCPCPGGRAFWNSKIHLSVPWQSCLGYRHAGCLQFSHHRPSEMCGLRKYLPSSNCHRRGAYRLATPRAIPCLHNKRQGKGKRSIAVRNMPHSYKDSRAICDHTVLPATRQK